MGSSQSAHRPGRSTCTTKRPGRRPGRFVGKGSDGANARGLGALGALADLELHALPLVEAPTRRIHAVHRDASARRPAVEAALAVLRTVWRERDELPDIAEEDVDRDEPGRSS